MERRKRSNQLRQFETLARKLRAYLWRAFRVDKKRGRYRKRRLSSNRRNSIPDIQPQCDFDFLQVALMASLFPSYAAHNALNDAEIFALDDCGVESGAARLLGRAAIEVVVK